MIVNEENAHDTQEFLAKRLSAIKNQRNTGDVEDLALIIGVWYGNLYNVAVFHVSLFLDGKSLSFALEKEMSKTFLELALMCKAVICCRFHNFPWGVHPT